MNNKDGQKAIVLIGMMGAGKSTLGPLLAEALSRPFFDSDALIEERASMTIPEIFAQQGEPAFRILEHEVIAACAQKNCVIATGGGCVETPSVREVLAQNAITIWLQTTKESLFERLRYDETRPRFAGCDDAERMRRIKEICAYRNPLYDSCADVKIPTDGKTKESALDDAIKALRAHI